MVASQVTVRLADMAGNAIDGATVTALLEGWDYADGFNIPQSVSALTDANGLAVLAISPSDGERQMRYRFTAQAAGETTNILDQTADVPDRNVFLSDIADKKRRLH